MRLILALTVILARWCVAADPSTSEFFQVTSEGTTTKLKAGEAGKLVLSISTKNGAHVSEEAPLKIELSSKESKLTKQKLTLADSVTRQQDGGREHPDPRFEVPFIPTAHGTTTLEAQLTFFLCTEKQCTRQSQKMTVPVEVM
jgi:hypothetical protein